MQRSLRRPRALFAWKLLPFAVKPSPASTLRHSTIPNAKLSPSSYRAHKVAFFHHDARLRQQAAAVAEAVAEVEMSGSSPPSDAEIDKATAMGPAMRFEELAQQEKVNRKIINTLTRTMKLETMTQVQSMTINEALKGVDVLAQARTGTGKTIGFLLPVLQNILSVDPELQDVQSSSQKRYNRGSAADIRAIIISPTRELAEQIAAEAQKLVQNTGVVIQTAVGGTQKGMHLRKIQREGCHILVGTPGRLKDIFSDQATGVSAPKLSALVLDEADRLMDAGFWPEIEQIQRLLPNKNEVDRQTLMFSATIPQEVVKLVRGVMKPNLHYVKTVQEDEEPTHERVKQSLVIVPGLENQLPAVLELCNREIMASQQDSSKRPFKAIVYFNATAETTLAASLFFAIRKSGLGSASTSHDSSVLGTKCRVHSIHSRLTQGARTAAAEQFRNSESAILMSSDVTARGMDFPNVTHVIQVGLPPTRDSYIHRLGRTARAGAEGEGWLILPQMAKREMSYRLGKLPLKPDTSLASATVDLSSSDQGKEPNIPADASAFLDAISMAAQTIPHETFERTYLALLGTGQWISNKDLLVEQMNRLARVQWGLSKPPGVGKGLANKLGLSKINGLNFESARDREPGRPQEVRDYDSRSSSGRRRGSSESGVFGGRSRESSGYERRTSSGGGGDRYGGDRAMDRNANKPDGDRSSRYGGDRSSRYGGDRGGGDRGGGDRGGGDRSGGDRGGRYGDDRGSRGFDRSSRDDRGDSLSSRFTDRPHKPGKDTSPWMGQGNDKKRTAREGW